MNSEIRMNYLSIDVGMVLHGLNSSPSPYLVTRTTGRDVRGVIEEKLSKVKTPVLSRIDFTAIEVMDFSCADEVVARLLVRFIDISRPQEAFFILSGLLPNHQDPVAEVLERQGTLAVAQDNGGSLELLGNVSSKEEKIWQFIETKGIVTIDEINSAFMEKNDQIALRRLIAQRVVFQETARNSYCSLGRAIEGWE